MASSQHFACICLLAATLLAAGCAEQRCFCGRPQVFQDVSQRFDLNASFDDHRNNLRLPNGAYLEDGLTEEEAVLISLWNNKQFQETLVDLDLAASDLVQAGLLPNPEVVYFFPVTDKPFKYALDFPLESLWLRPIRLDVAERESNRTCQRLSQAALDLIRDTRQAYSDHLLAQDRLTVAQQAFDLRRRIARLAKARVAAGDGFPQEISVAEIDANLAMQDITRLKFEVGLAEERLKNLLGYGGYRQPLILQSSPPPVASSLDPDALVETALNGRPDFIATEIAVSAAESRLRLAEISWFRILGILDATSGRRTGHEFSPALRMTLPIFNTNEGAISRAQAEFDRASRQQQTVQDRIMLEVHQAHLRYAQARAELKVLDEQVLPEVETGIKRAEAAFREGDAPYLVVLQVSRQLFDSLARRQQLQGDLRRSWAELERSVGQHLSVDTPMNRNTREGAEEIEVPAKEGRGEG